MQQIQVERTEIREVEDLVDLNTRKSTDAFKIGPGPVSETRSVI
jgi:hypothetical protein